MKLQERLNGVPANFNIEESHELVEMLKPGNLATRDAFAEDLRDQYVPNPTKLAGLTRLALDFNKPVIGLDSTHPVLKAFGTEIPLDRSVFLRKGQTGFYPSKDYSNILGEKVQIIDIVEVASSSGKKELFFVILRNGSSLDFGASLYNANNVAEIAFEKDLGKKVLLKSTPLQQAYLPSGHINFSVLDSKNFEVLNMQLPLDRDITFYFNYNCPPLVGRPIVPVFGGDILIRSSDSGAGTLISQSNLKACVFKYEKYEDWASKEQVQHKVAQFIEEQSSSEQSSSEQYVAWDYEFHSPRTADPYWQQKNPFSVNLNEDLPIEGLLENYIVAYGAYIPRDRPVRINPRGNLGINSFYAQILDVSVDNRIIFLPINTETKPNYQYPNWNGPKDGVLSIYVSSIESLAFIPPSLIKNTERNTFCLYPSYCQSLHAQPATHGIPFGRETLPLDQELTVRLVNGANIKVLGLWHTRYGELMIRPAKNSSSGPCMLLRQEQVDMIRVSANRR